MKKGKYALVPPLLNAGAVFTAQMRDTVYQCRRKHLNEAIGYGANLASILEHGRLPVASGTLRAIRGVQESRSMVHRITMCLEFCEYYARGHPDKPAETEKEAEKKAEEDAKKEAEPEPREEADRPVPDDIAHRIIPRVVMRTRATKREVPDIEPHEQRFDIYVGRIIPRRNGGWEYATYISTPENPATDAPSIDE